MAASRGDVPTIDSSELKELTEKLLTACHILDHEDQGMMQNIRIAIPDGRGGVAASHH